MEALAERELRRQVAELGEWFHNLDLGGIRTAPEHFLGDFPGNKWRHLAPCLPEDLAGASVLDVGCNAGFYCFALKRRGAGRVLGLDVDERYLRQARFAAEFYGLEVEFRRLSVYDVGQLREPFDYVLFMGLFYHLRYPVYALDLMAKRTRGRLIFQSMVRGASEGAPKPDYDFWDEKPFRAPGFPAMRFFERSLAGDPTNWWVPNEGAVEGLLRSGEWIIEAHPEPEIWICRPAAPEREDSVWERELEGRL